MATITSPPRSPDAPARGPATASRRSDPGRARRWPREVALVAVFYAAYSVVRNLTRHDAGAAYDNAGRVLDLQHRVGIDIEQLWQAAVLPHRGLVIGANYFYGSATFVVTAATLVHLWRRHPGHYRRLRAVLATIVGLALIGYVAFPLMPPRLLGAHDPAAGFGYVDTLATYPTFWSFASGTVDSVSNQFAAMPSLHCAFALWCAAALAPRCRRRSTRILAVAYPAITLAVVIATGNHYLLDGIGAAGVVLLAFALVHAADRRRATAPRWTRSQPAPSERPVRPLRQAVDEEATSPGPGSAEPVRSMAAR